MWRLSLTCALLAACSNNNGARDQCAEGGALEQCTAEDLTPEGACWKLVDCGAIDLETKNNDNFDWGAKCYAALLGAPSDQQQLAIDCIAAATCDSLKVQGSPDNPNTDDMTCLALGNIAQ
jgi:hypothetical protein